ncbi:GLPGLI family protein [Psychroflexus salis]|uniref:GLPGLI family protein n=1 Tax=Psychroflexus salis TaxID=1526574 RepID=A0A916ZTA9_9FLAO|nr:GLPGLI family protein [Psychroflexus salis]GGE12862.1 GLPGLI family protein [Psychroflexus salis]
MIFRSELKFLSIVVLFLSFFELSHAQDFQGKAIYQTKTTMDLGDWGGREMSEQQRKQIMERMKSFLEKTFILNFNKTESIYKEDEKLAAPGSGGGWGGFASSFTGGPQYKNVKNQELLQEQEFFGKRFLIKDELKKLDWKMTSETKQIGQYMCFKAIAIKEVDEFDWRSMRRRNTDEQKKNEKEVDTTNTKTVVEDIEIPKTIEIVAWYTPQIPVNQGPGEYWGLPGLILEVNADKTTILCTKIVLNPAEREDIIVPSKGQEITQEEYNKTIKQKMEEMREMYGGRNRGR